MSLSLKDKKILISPLDWGLGHTTRIIPIIKELQSRNAFVSIACNNTQKKLLQDEITNATFIPFEGYNITYSEVFFNLKIASQIPKIVAKIKEENKALRRIQDEKQFDIIISDNRFGFYHKETPSFYITHQINIQSPFGNELLKKLHLKYINKFTSTFIPDYENRLHSLAGKLSHPTSGKNQFYIGPLTRFEKPAISNDLKFEFLAIISGPEPHRSSLEKLLIEKFKETEDSCAIIGGNLNGKNNQIDNISYFNHLSTNDFYNLVCQSKNIIIRSGYSSIMDFETLQKPLLTTPTPGQTEQEYLSKYLNEKFNIPTIQQKGFKNIKLEDVSFNKLPKNTFLPTFDFSNYIMKQLHFNTF